MSASSDYLGTTTGPCYRREGWPGNGFCPSRADRGWVPPGFHLGSTFTARVSDPALRRFGPLSDACVGKHSRDASERFAPLPNPFRGSHGRYGRVPPLGRVRRFSPVRNTAAAVRPYGNTAVTRPEAEQSAERCSADVRLPFRASTDAPGYSDLFPIGPNSRRRPVRSSDPVNRAVEVEPGWNPGGTHPRSARIDAADRLKYPRD